MKKELKKYFAILPICVFLAACASTDPLTSVQDFEVRNVIQNNSSNLDHENLAEQYENLANDIKAKAKEHKNIITKKLRGRSFKKNGWHFKSRAALIARKYEKSAQENLARAAYHKRLAAEQASRKTATEINPSNEEMNEVKKKLDNSNNDAL